MTIDEVETKLVETISDTVNQTNSCGINYEEMSDRIALAIYRNHRTLQQSYWRLIAGIIKSYAKLCKERGTDLRNEAAAEWCDKVAEATKETYLPFI